MKTYWRYKGGAPKDGAPRVDREVNRFDSNDVLLCWRPLDWETFDMLAKRRWGTSEHLFRQVHLVSRTYRRWRERGGLNPTSGWVPVFWAFFEELVAPEDLVPEDMPWRGIEELIWHFECQSMKDLADLTGLKHPSIKRWKQEGSTSWRAGFSPCIQIIRLGAGLPALPEDEDEDDDGE